MNETTLTITEDIAVPEEQTPLVHLVATDAMQMASSQSKLVLWLKDKQIDIDSEISELTIARDQARAKKWGTATFGTQINRATKRKVFYDKLLVAAEAGYTIIPNFPLDLMAVKVEFKEPRDTDVQRWNNQPMPATSLAEKADILPAGQGEYVSPIPNVKRWHENETGANNQRVVVHSVRAVSLKDMEFPVSVAVPQIMEATAKAMALKVFDQIGICPAKGLRGAPHRHGVQQLPPSRDPDPLIIGQILTPRQGYAGARPVSFLIAWHLDLRAL